MIEKEFATSYIPLHHKMQQTYEHWLENFDYVEHNMISPSHKYRKKQQLKGKKIKINLNYEIDKIT